MEYFVTFLEGLASFISPCMLPLLPLYVSYFTVSNNSKSKGNVFLKSLAFVLGFGVIFCTLGALAGTLGALLSEYREYVNIACGVIIIFFGLCYLGVIKLSFLKGVESAKGAKNALAAFLFGCVYALNLTPCVGPLLGSALSLAANSASTLKGVVLLVSYTLGLGIPFIVSALLLDKLKSFFGFIKRNYKVINAICGALLIIMGAFMVIKSISPIIIQRYENSKANSDNANLHDYEIELSSSNFNIQVIASSVPVLVDFWADWCPPCKMLAPELLKVAEDYNGIIKVGKVNSDIEAQLSRKYSIMYLPTLILFVNGNPIKISSGYKSYNDIVNYFELDKYKK